MVKSSKWSAAHRRKFEKTMRRKRAAMEASAMPVDGEAAMNVIKPLAPPIALTREEEMRYALRNITFSYTIFFTNEKGQTVKMYAGVKVEKEADKVNEVTF